VVGSPSESFRVLIQVLPVFVKDCIPGTSEVGVLPVITTPVCVSNEFFAIFLGIFRNIFHEFLKNQEINNI
ncbi:hypothetical protein ACPXAO_25265, partial [Salmonella enterica]|uniref:hypothetical protein n=1 Tax=Salmonella enterica TaxID=28901 RepID=UPI003CF59D30